MPYSLRTQGRTVGSGLRANYLRTLLGSGQTGNGANREAAAHAADGTGSGVEREAAAPAADCRWTALGPSDLGRNRGEDHKSTAGPERGGKTQLRVWAVAQSGGGAVPGRASGAHMRGSARCKRLQERAQEGRVSPASTSQQQQAGLALAATERSGPTVTRRLAQLVSAEQQRVAPAGRGTRVSEASTQLPERQLPLETGSEAKAKQSKPAAGGAEHKVHCSGKSCSIAFKA